MASAFQVPLAPPDALFALNARCKADPSPNKINLTIGAYRDTNGKPWILPTVAKADAAIAADPSTNHEYLGIAGLPELTSAAAALVFGPNSKPLQDGRVVSIQTISGTGANHTGAIFCARNPLATRPAGSGDKVTIWMPTPTWANHNSIFSKAGLEVKQYPYWNAATMGLDFDGLKKTLTTSAQPGDLVLLHACAHNPTGVDPTQEQWKEIGEICKSKKLFPFFDCAYQGFASGDLDKDAWAVRYFANDLGLELLVCQSFAKNCGLYGERAGCLHFITDDKSNVAALSSQLAAIQRSEISSPPAYGARIVSKILNDKTLFEEWAQDLKTMANRIDDMRQALYKELQALKTPGSWNHIVDQIGMFSFTGLKPDQVKKIIDEHHVYMADNGRVSMAGINEGNVKYLAKAIDSVVKETSSKI